MSVLAAIPDAAVPYVAELLEQNGLQIKITPKRHSKHGDYRKLPDGSHLITLNSEPNTHRFLITLIHELAHYFAFVQFGYRIKPHGKEWKMTYKKLMLPLLHPKIFPETVLQPLAGHMKNPKASTDTDFQLVMALATLGPQKEVCYIFELEEGAYFKIYNGKIFQKGKKRTKRFECVERSSGKTYLISPHAEVVQV
jgi:SprT protein